MRRVVIVTTMWGKVTPEEGRRREAGLIDSELFFKTAIEQGARIIRHDNTPESAQRIIQSLSGSTPETLTIQNEMVEEEKQVVETEAGCDLQTELERLKRIHRDEIQAVKNEMAQLVTRNDKKHREEVQELKTALSEIGREMEKVRKSNEYLQKENPAERFYYNELAKRLAADLRDRERFRALIEKAEIRERDTMEELQRSGRKRRSSGFFMAAVGCILGAGAMVVTQDVNLSMKIVTTFANLGMNTATKSLEDYVPKAKFR